MENKNQKEKNYFFYVLECADHSFYGGFTNNLEKRVATHNKGQGAKYTKTRRPVTLLHAEIFPTKSLALKAEYAFKHQSRAKKMAYLASHQNLNIATDITNTKK
ncbi:GIY-YIG nuclease family protein [Enterococcus timonensis]|uniref:GIY-YIG nuclease family protein n=1 Tax=Enterococcus timonensis TaxID=1852364 RepID=UPI0008DA3BC3|nr:GIY-YIG nuclease family protein [Enterococcus timonensis]